MALRDRFRLDDLGPKAMTAVMAVLALVVAACNDGTSATPATTAATVPPTTVPPTTVAPSTAALATDAPPDESPLDVRIGFVVAALNDPAVLTDVAIAEHFSPDFLVAVRADDIRAVLADATSGSVLPWAETDRMTEGVAALSTLTDAAGTTLSLELAVEPGQPGRIASAQLRPGSIGDIEQAFAEPGTIAEIDASLSELAGRVVYGVYDTSGGGCSALDERDAAIAVPTGSTFKLWVLATLARAVDSGEASWDETFALDPAYRSSPDGEVSSRPDGTDITLRELAGLMISISDNTATDLLIARLGRQAIERTMAEIGVSTVDRNTPFLSTAELFKLKFIDPTLGDRYLALDDAEQRRAFLDREVAATPLPWLDDPSWSAGAEFSTPTWIDELEWFATPADVCLTFHDLDRLAAEPGLEPVAEILSINPGLPFPAGQWSTIRFKGGSEPGVTMFAYWLESPRGAKRVVVLSLTDDQRLIGDIAAATAAARLLGHVAAGA
jgi:beta-lactamase class A